jgi:translation initiation factor IF-1
MSKYMSLQEIERNGTVIEVLGGARFRVSIIGNANNDPVNEKEVVAAVRGKMHQRRIKIVKGDKVKMKIIIIDSLDNMTCTIVFRL